MNLLQSIIYGFVSGLSEFMPTSSRGHQQILLQLFGCQKDPLMDLFVHMTLLASLYFGARNLVDAFMRERRIAIRRSRNTVANHSYIYPFIRTASIALVLVYVLLTYTCPSEYSFLNLALFCLINGILLFIPDRMIQGNKTLQHMSVLDSVLMGTAGALSVFPGFSRIGVANAYVVGRGADRQQAFNWVILLSFPAVALLILLDIIALFTGNLSITFMKVLGYLFAVISSYIGGYLSVSLTRFLAVKIGFSAFSYYAWGMALFAFVLYLI